MAVRRRTATLVPAIGLACSYAVVQWLARTRGATGAERTGPMPGDALVPDAQVQVTRSATLDAPPDRVWPWLVQVGWGRAGWYTPRWVDRVFFPANGPSATTVRPELQDLAVGDWVPDGPPDTQCGFVVTELEPGRHIVLHSTSHLPLTWRKRGTVGIDWSWSFVLLPEGEGAQTRVVFRWRGLTWPWRLTALVHLVIVPADWIMSRGMLRGLAERVSGPRSRRHGVAPPHSPSTVREVVRAW